MSAQWFGKSAAFCSSHLRIVAMLHLNRIPSQAMHIRQVTKKTLHGKVSGLQNHAHRMMPQFGSLQSRLMTPTIQASGWMSVQ